MAADEDGEHWSQALPPSNTSDPGQSENMTGTVRLDGVRISDRHLSEDGTFDNVMQTDGDIFFADNHHGSHRHLSSEHLGVTTGAYLSGNTTDRDLLDNHDQSNQSMAEDQNHHSHA